MTRVTKTTIFMVIVMPLVWGVPYLVTVYLPSQLIVFTKLSGWFVIASIIILLGPAGKHRIEHDDSQLLLTSTQRLFAIVLIFLLTNGLFIGQALTIVKYSHANAAYVFSSLFRALSLGGMMLPWCAIATVATSFTICSQKKHPFLPFSQWLPPLPWPQLTRMLKKLSSSYIDVGSRIFITTALAFAAVQLFQAYHYQHLTVTKISLSFVILVLLCYHRRFNHIEAILTKKSIAPIVVFIMTLAAIVLIALLAHFILVFFSSHMPKGASVLPNKPIVIIRQPWRYSWPLWLWSWWVIAIPFVASLIVRCSLGITIRAMVMIIIMIALLSTGLFNVVTNDYLVSTMQWLLSRPFIVLSLQMSSIIALLMLFISPKSHHTLWLGFFSLKTPLRLRIVPLKRIWLVTAAIFSAFFISGWQSIILLQMLAALGNFVIMLLSICYQ